MNDLHVTIRRDMPTEVPLFRWYDRGRGRDTVWLNPDQRALWPAAAAEVGLDVEDLLQRAIAARERPDDLTAEVEPGVQLRAAGWLSALLAGLVVLDLA